MIKAVFVRFFFSLIPITIVNRVMRAEKWNEGKSNLFSRLLSTFSVWTRNAFVKWLFHVRISVDRNRWSVYRLVFVLLHSSRFFSINSSGMCYFFTLRSCISFFSFWWWHFYSHCALDVMGNVCELYEADESGIWFSCFSIEKGVFLLINWARRNTIGSYLYDENLFQIKVFMGISCNCFKLDLFRLTLNKKWRKFPE